MNSDDIALNALKNLGYQVEKIPTSNKKEADFLVQYKGSTALVEAKLKEDSSETVNKKESDLAEIKVSVVDSQLG